ncbi:MAG TPA: hypothetical protein VGH28_23600 [Polyangiaceae bacterium]|jgi:hypothetical protein
MQNRIFFPQAALDQWVIDGQVELAGNQLTIIGEGRRYRIAEAVRVVAEVSGTADQNDVIGKVKSRVFFEELGAEILEESMIIGENAYEVKTGWLGAPTVSLEDHVRERQSSGLFTEEPKTDEDLLARFLLKNL